MGGNHKIVSLNPLYRWIRKNNILLQDVPFDNGSSNEITIISEFKSMKPTSLSQPIVSVHFGL